MNRGLRTIWSVSLLGLAYVLLTASSWSPPVAAKSPAAEEVSLGPAPSGRTVHRPNWSPFATVGGVTLVHPASRVERIGFHESNHDGARQLEVHSSATDPVTLESRGRGTGSRSAADVVVQPQVEIRAPVSGRVIRSGTYRLYCDYFERLRGNRSSGPPRLGGQAVAHRRGACRTG